MITQPQQRLKGFNFDQKFSRNGDTPSVDFSRYLQQINALLNFQQRLIAPAAQTVGASPWVYTNNTGNDQSEIVQGGTVTKIEFSRNGGSYIDTGVTAGMFQLSPLDSLRVTYAVVPTINVVVR
jgi:hypothetical protein